MPAGSEPVRLENPDPEVPGGARDPEVPGGAQDPMRDDVDGDEAMLPRVEIHVFTAIELCRRGKDLNDSGVQKEDSDKLMAALEAPGDYVQSPTEIN